MAEQASYKDDLVAAYDSDVERRNAMTPAVWRTDIVDRFTESARELDAESVLELGCGTGQLARYVADKGFDVVAIDLSPENVQSLVGPDWKFRTVFGHSIVHPHVGGNRFCN